MSTHRNIVPCKVEKMIVNSEWSISSASLPMHTQISGDFLKRKRKSSVTTYRSDRLRCVRTKDGAVPNSAPNFAPNFAPKLEKLNGKKSKKAQKKAENKHFQLIFSLYGADEGT